MERFRYRFELWRREQREGSFWRPSPRSVDLGEPAIWENPKYEILWTESTPSFIMREVSLYVGILLSFQPLVFSSTDSSHQRDMPFGSRFCGS